MLLHDGFGQRPLPEPPYGWIISRICEEFPAYTVETAEQAWENDPILIAEIIELRAFASAKAHIEGASDWSDLKLTQSVKTYMQIEALVHAEKAGR